MIKVIHKSSHNSIPVLLNISSNYSKFHFLELFINTLCILTQTLQNLIRFSIMPRHKSLSYKGFHLIPSINLPFIISPTIYHRLIPLHNGIVSKSNNNKLDFLGFQIIGTLKNPLHPSFSYSI
jgi:hypothetical protein